MNHFVNYNGSVSIRTHRAANAVVTDLEDIAAAINSGRDEVLVASIDSLEDLCALLDGVDNSLFDLSDLPTFGGEGPRDTMEIFSWDEDRILVHSDEWKIQPRCSTCGEAEFHCNHE